MREGGRAIQDAVKAQDSALVSARDDVADWLAGYGWQAIVHAGSDPAIGYGRVLPEMPAGWLACATRGSGTCPAHAAITRRPHPACTQARPPGC